MPCALSAVTLPAMRSKNSELCTTDQCSGHGTPLNVLHGTSDVRHMVQISSSGEHLKLPGVLRIPNFIQ